ncbi:MAG: hypothetical protein SFU98_03440 [Leptospiraceae bacterium]|nr:hypothetical protein [Leptospiraceae bacterium]
MYSSSIALIIDYEYYEDLYENYLRERKIFSNLHLFGNIIGYGSFFIYLFLIIVVGNLSLKFIALDFFSIFTRVSVIVLWKYFEVPNLVSNLLSHEEKLVIYSYKTINSHREEILGCFFKNIYGLGYDRTLLNIGLEDLQRQIIELDRFDWKKFGSIYCYFYPPVSISLLSIPFF